MSIIIAALSGGSDSVAMLHYLLANNDGKAPGVRIIATHCNFHLRGDESMRDQHFCENLCRQLGVELMIKDFDTRGYMAEQHLSLELAARRLRYEWWDKLANEFEQQGHSVRIAVGHHRDDSIETMLFHLMRGTGIKGLTGIPMTNGRIIRPLSSWTRQDILDYLDSHGLSYITDSTNLENEAVRNKIRNQLLPLMEQINPTARAGIANTMQHLQFSSLMADQRLDGIFSSTQTCVADNVMWHEWTIDPEFSADTDLMNNLFHHWSERFGDAEHTPHNNGRIFYTEPSASLIEAQKCLFSTETINFDHPLDMAQMARHGGYELFDAAKVRLPLTFRHWQKHDRIQPLGMSGTKLVSDLFSNAHFSPVRKATTWIVTDADERIIWVTGLRIADWCKVTADTRQILKINK